MIKKKQKNNIFQYSHFLQLEVIICYYRHACFVLKIYTKTEKSKLTLQDLLIKHYKDSTKFTVVAWLGMASYNTNYKFEL